MHYDIRSKLTPYDIESFSRLMAAAIRAEKLVIERKAFFAARADSSKRSGKCKEHPDSSSASKKKDKIIEVVLPVPGKKGQDPHRRLGRVRD